MASKIDNLLDRLRGKYSVPVADGAGLLDGKDTFVRQFETPPISHEAAATIEALRAMLREKCFNTSGRSEFNRQGFSLIVEEESAILSINCRNAELHPTVDAAIDAVVPQYFQL